VVIDSSAATSPSTDIDKASHQQMMITNTKPSTWGFGLRLALKVLCVVLILLVIAAVVVVILLVGS
jgi:hypothetical protein